MTVNNTALIEYFSDKTGLPSKILQSYLDQPQTEYYNLKYYLTNAYFWHRISWGTIRDLFLSYLPTKMDVAMDIGFGCGLYSKLILKRTEKYIGVDSSRSAIELAKRLYHNSFNMKFICEDAAKSRWRRIQLI